MAAGKPDVMLLLMNKLIEDGNVLYKVLPSLFSQFDSISLSFDGICVTDHNFYILSYDIASGSEITPCNKICKPLVVYRFSRNVIMSITRLHT